MEMTPPKMASGCPCGSLIKKIKKGKKKKKIKTVTHVVYRIHLSVYSGITGDSQTVQLANATTTTTAAATTTTTARFSRS